MEGKTLEGGTPVEIYWGSMYKSFMTMMMCITEDGWVSDVARPVMEVRVRVRVRVRPVRGTQYCFVVWMSLLLWGSCL